MKIGFIGLGRMGSGMVRSLLRAGHSVVVYNRTREKAEPLRQAGATVAGDICDACRGDAVITMVADDEAVDQLVCAAGGVLDCLEPNKTVHISASTISPLLVHRLAERHRERNQKFLSAPVLGRPAAAEHGKLIALVAGARDEIEQLRPVFDALAQQTIVISTAAPEAANLMKITCNMLIAAILETIGETCALTAKSGVVDPKTYFEVLHSTVLPGPVYEPYSKELLDQDFKPGFRLPLALKDMELVLGAGRHLTVPMPLASLLRDHMLEAVAAGYGDLDWAAFALVPRKEAGLSTPPVT